jgi:type 1 glutamine amidotransferase
MMAALPGKAPATPLKPRKVLVLAKAAGFVHSCIPLAAKTVEALGTRTGAWTTAITYDSADITEQNLRHFDALFLDNTTGAFLDDPTNASATAARKRALVEFVRSGKGLAGIHAAGDAYHEDAHVAASVAAPGAGASRAGGPGASLASQMLAAGDTNKDQKLSGDELNALADDWFARLDAEREGKLSQGEFVSRFASVLPPPPPPAPHAVPQGRDTQVGTWPEFDRMIGGFFKFHWLYPQLITTRIDDPASPVTAMFHGQSFDIHDETYTFGMDTWSRTNLHVLTSIDYSKMSDADKAKEDYPRADHDYGLSWIHREGKGRVFYEAHGHHESIYALTPMLEHVLAGVQYALGDLKADDSPSVRAKK